MQTIRRLKKAIVLGIKKIIKAIEQSEKDLCPNCGYYCNCSSTYCLPPEEKEEMFYHPVTGYKGTKAEMDTYIMNRERELKNE